MGCPLAVADAIKRDRIAILVRYPLEQNTLGNDFVGCRNGIVAGIKNLSGAELGELVFA